MKLQSARDLKKEVLETIVYPLVASSLIGDSQRNPSSKSKSRIKRVGRMNIATGSNARKAHRSIAIGVGHRNGEFKLAVRVQRHSLMHSSLIEKIVAKAKGEVDVRLVGHAGKLATPIQGNRSASDTLPWYQLDNRPMHIGGSVGHFQVTGGTIGAFVKSDAQTCILSNNHVLANENDAQIGDPILQRACIDGGRPGPESVASLVKWVPLSTSTSNIVDAAIAAVSMGSFDPSTLIGINGQNQALRGTSAAVTFGEVYKIGRSTGPRQGRITAIEMNNITLGYDLGDMTFNEIIEIESANGLPFCDNGDSGSLIVNDQFEAVGLLCAQTDYGASNNLGLGYANPISSVLDALSVELMIMI